MTFRNYDPSEVALSWMGINITGYSDGTFIEAERDEDAFTKYVGALGDVTRARNLNRSGKVTVTLMASAPVNDLIAAIASVDDAFGSGGVGPLSITDFNGTTVCGATYAWVMKQPKIERAKEAGTVQWVFDCAQLFIKAGGNLV
jgi:hypothetical protein